MTYVLFIIGFVILIKGADLLVEGSSSLAKKYGVSELIIGLTIVAIGTSAPELVVNLFSNAQGSGGLALGNILGSNIANILLILGISACIYPLIIHKSIIYREIPFSLAAIAVLNVFINGNAEINRFEGVALLVFFGLFLIYIFLVARHDREQLIEKVKTESAKKSVICIILGLIGLVVGGKWIVNGAIDLATYMGLSELTIGLTIVAIGTSLPELATSVVAIRKKKGDIAIGNIVGSNIFNIFRVVGITATIHPIEAPVGIHRDIRFAVFATLVLAAFAIIGKKFTLHRYQGLIMIIAYVIYISILLLNR